MLRAFVRRHAADVRRTARVLASARRPRRRPSTARVGAIYRTLCQACGEPFTAVVVRVHAARRKRCDRCKGGNGWPLGGPAKWGSAARRYLRAGDAEAAAAAVLLRHVHLRVNGQATDGQR
jgi:hypothetical protein